MHDPFDNPEIAAASRKRGGGGRVVNASHVPVDPAIQQRPVPVRRGVFVSGAARPCPSPPQLGRAPAAPFPGSIRCRSPALRRPSGRAVHH